MSLAIGFLVGGVEATLLMSTCRGNWLLTTIALIGGFIFLALRQKEHE